MAPEASSAGVPATMSRDATITSTRFWPRVMLWR